MTTYRLGSDARIAEYIISQVARQFRVSEDLILSRRNPKKLYNARVTVYRRLRRELDLSWDRIAYLMGGRHPRSIRRSAIGEKAKYVDRKQQWKKYRLENAYERKLCRELGIKMAEARKLSGKLART